VSTLTEIIGGLKDRLLTIEAFDSQVLDVVRRPATFPAAIIVPPTIPNYGTALSGQGADFTIPVLVVVSAIEAEGQQSLFPFLDWEGVSSIPAAVYADRKLGGLDVDARVIAAVEPGLVDFGDGTPAYGVTLNVHVLAS
jgi:hypothetical protein